MVVHYGHSRYGHSFLKAISGFSILGFKEDGSPSRKRPSGKTSRT